MTIKRSVSVSFSAWNSALRKVKVRESHREREGERERERARDTERESHTEKDTQKTALSVCFS